MRSKSKCYDFGACCTALMLVMAAAPAVQAQETPVAPSAPQAEAGTDGGVIMVTARRREESLLETPVTLSVMTAANLAKLNVNNVLDLQAFTPGLYAQQTSSGRVDRSYSQIVIRGIADPLNPTVSVFLDGTPVNFDVINNLGNEVSRVEVLKGPQSAAFGRQSFAGAINVVTRDPGDAFRWNFDGTAGSYSLYDIKASVELPIVKDAIGLRIGGRRYGFDGQYTNPYDGSRLGAQQTETINGTLVIKPFDGLRLKAFGMYLEDHDGAGAAGFSSRLPVNTFNCNAGAAPTNVNNFYCGKIPQFPTSQMGQNPATPAFIDQVVNNSLGRLNPTYKAINDHAGLERREIVTNLAVDFTIPGTDIVLSSLTGYNKTRFQSNQDLDGRDTSGIPNTTVSTIPGFVGDPFINYPTMAMYKESAVSQEFRVTSGANQPLRWMVGANYFKVSNRSYTVALYPNTIQVFGDGSLNTLVDKSVFGSVSYDFSPRFTLNAEGRYIEEELKVYFRDPQTLRTSGKYKRFVPRVSAQYKFTPDLMGYATYSRGMNKGGFNLSVLPLTAAQRAYLEERASVTNIYKPAVIDNYELGLKGTVADVFSFSAAVFYAKWKDQAITNSIQVPNATPGASDIGVGVTQNTGRSTVKGAEIEGNLKVTHALSLNFNAGYNKVELDTSIPCASCVAITGNSTVAAGAQNPAAPVFTSNVGAEYGVDIGDGYRWFLRGDYAHRSRIYTTYENISWIGDANKVNLRTGISSEHLDVQFFVNNVFNDKSYTGVQTTTSLLGGNAVVLSMPVKRNGGIRVRFGF
ncbi:TonB-dependent receptor [Novosphingobium resinovorum]|uniref:TonB-dependent receptor n=1 Tax=Sphingomonadaceae TaxID=41297 RepID=UPI00027CA733|nr:MULTISPECIES: TonB-dependent receptor [Sphingomonadaceae]EJU12816.1 TonB-dependent receptor, plug [Sphingomonas sp. LH128]MBF7014080.1 TonB-dependent receptor [Novosphingobium sp. HR1a]WJM26224.1 TonB-dependent receptor [Novosphingobium resinovorum]